MHAHEGIQPEIKPGRDSPSAKWRRSAMAPVAEHRSGRVRTTPWETPTQIAAMAAYDRRLFERSGDLIAMVRDAGRTEPELAAVYRDARGRADAFRTEVFASWPHGALRTDVAESVEVYAALCSIDVYTDLTETRSWSPDRVESWWAAALPRELLAD
ncbi:hypothetical protein [Glycomyces niveus]|uniref:TipAS antibiotic-recognition domain-containing protein n=1 Tax=Glycomyces niveus TaxID=2820287 RepID=A0ABS3U2H2_9ACTN|nr:hypothetical protein [Glycomyces sp. NEAU-S30]MBO3732970.1 hypothetical protein [Glycomyces sp. NEAU-S30]